MRKGARTAGRLLAIHAEYDRTDAETVSCEKNDPSLRSDADYDATLNEIARCFENEPKPSTSESYNFNLLALVIEDYERKRWPIEPPDAIDAIRYRMETGGYTQADLGRLLGS